MALHQGVGVLVTTEPSSYISRVRAENTVRASIGSDGCSRSESLGKSSIAFAADRTPVTTKVEASDFVKFPCKIA